MSSIPEPDRWHRLPADQQGKAVCDIADHLWDDGAAWRTQLLEFTSWYEGFRVLTLDAAAYQHSVRLNEADKFENVSWNVPRALVQSLTAKVAGRQKPKPQMVCTDTDWTTKRRAKRLERFAEACLYQPQGQYRDAWQLGTQAFVDCCVWGLGVVKAFADTVGMRFVDERVFPWEILVDPLEAERGQPLNLFHRYHYDRDRLAAAFPKHREAINRARDEEKGRPVYSAHLRVARQCLVREAWRLPLGDKDKGRHVIAINGETLLSEEWTRDEFPFLFLRYAPHLLGFGSGSLVEESLPTAREMNASLARMAEGERKLAAGAIVYEEGSIEDTALADAKIGALLAVKPGTMPPQVFQPQGFSDSTMSWMRMQWDKSFELTGVSQMGATSRKEPGVTAGVALRTLAQMETERFAVVYGAYEQALAVDLTRHHIACAREVAEANKGKFSLRWPGGRFLNETDWSEASLEDDQYVLQSHAVSGLVNTPADRLQLGQDLFNSGTISQDAFLRITQLKDVDGELKVKNVQHELVEHYVESWLEAEPEDEEDGSFRYRPPVPFMNHAEAIVEVATAYLQAELDGCPDWNLQFFTNFITQCDGFIQKAAAKQAAASAPPPPPAPAPVGAPMPPPAAGPAQMLN